MNSYSLVPSPVRELKLVASPYGLVAILWPQDNPKRVMLDEQTFDPDHPILRATTVQLAEYFARTRTAFDIPLAPRGTEFQRKVWQALTRIPYGETRSYGDLAREVGVPNGARAVGAANGRNPISIIVPCHRAIGGNGALTGFAGGLDAKRFLLALEGGAELEQSQAELPL
ncbi:cysteine methyltransferase [Hyphomicrobium methylovorum]|nr:methylated-DNA--[protein]-cysteine S-methyltransferase [Hyphomicrobium methylovorum]MBA2125588.1 cysteine methyltransferase [Hyphomicrobium methylovorum]